MVGELRYVCVETNDLAGARAHFTGKLGLRVTEEGDGWFVLDGGGLPIVVWEGPNPGTLMGFVAPDLEAAHARLKEAGAQVGEIEPNPGGRHFYVTGPDGTQAIVFDN